MYKHYTCMVYYQYAEGGSGSVQWTEQGKLNALTAAARMAGYYQGLGSKIVDCRVSFGPEGDRRKVNLPDSMRESLGI